MFRKMWRRLTQSDERVSSSIDDAKGRRWEPSFFERPRIYVDRTGASHYVDTPEKLVNFHLNNGDFCYRNGEYAEAISHFNEAISVIYGTSYHVEKWTAAALAYGRRGNAHFWMGNYDRAIEDYNRAIELEPEVFARAPLHVGRGKAYIREGENDKAIQDLDKAISLDARSAEAYFDRGHAHTNKGEFGEAARDFSKANELDSEFVYSYMTRVYGVELDNHNRACSPYEIIGRIRENNIGLGIIDFVSAIRSRKGLPEPLGNSTLGMAAMPLSSELAVAEMSLEQVMSEFSQRIRENEYSGWAVAPYYREVWPMDTTDEEIIAGMADELCRQVDRIAYEDFGLGIIHGYPNDDHSKFGVCIVMGVGCTDGSAYALGCINGERVASGAEPLKVNDRLRTLARRYISNDHSLEMDKLENDMVQSGYAPEGFRIRFAYNGAFCPIPEDTDAYSLTYEQLGNLAASGLLREHKDDLVRIDWQDIGISIRVVSSAPGIPGPAVQAEFVIGWRIPADNERPDHFPPPPIGESVAN